MLPSGGDSLWDYIPSLPGAVTAYDIAYDQGDIWVACDNAGNSIQRYDTGGAVTGWIERTLVPDAEGLATDDAGFLWASDNENHLIYRIDPMGSPLEPSTWGGIKAQ